MSSYFQHVRKPKDVRSRQEKGGNEDQDLTTILDRAQRGDLTVLIAQITEVMRKLINVNFDVCQAPEDPTENLQGTEEQDTSAETISEKDENSPRKQNVPTGKLDLKAKAETLRYFDDWRDSVLLRIGQVVNKPDEIPRDTRQQSASQSRPQSEDTSTQKGSGESAHLQAIYPAIDSPLSKLPRSEKLLILHSLLLLLLSLKHYSAHSRVLLLYVASSLDLSSEDLNYDEAKVARSLLDAAVMMSGDEEAKKKADDGRNARRWKVGIASVAGAALIGITGGLAAPLVAAGIGTIMGGLGLGATAAAGYLGVLASSGVIVGGLFGAYGGRMTGRMMDKYAREVEDFAFIPVRGQRRDFKDEKDAAQQDRRLRVTIGITGWATEEDNIIVPWRVIGPDSEVFALRWELEVLLNLGNAIHALVTSAAWTVAAREILSRTIFAQIMNAIMLPMGLLKVARIVDNPFSVAKSRADKTGEVLADALINKAQGERPVTLIGYSLGSRVVFSCLQSLAKRRAYGLVENAILMGSPIPSNFNHWRMMRTVVSGRLVNVFSENDAVLALLYRASSAQFGIAGLQRIEDVPGVESMNASDLISGHLRYQYLVGKILTEIGFDEIDAAEVRREEAALQAQDQAVEEERERNEQQRGTEQPRVTTQSQGKHDDTGPDANDNGNVDFDHGERERLEREVPQQTQEQTIRRKMRQMDLHRNEEPRGPHR